MLSKFLWPCNDSEINVAHRTFFNDTYSIEGSFPDIKNSRVAMICKNQIIGNNVRNSLENFKNHFENILIIDLGNLISVDKIDFNDILNQITAHKIIPILLGFDAKIAMEYMTSTGHHIHIITNQILSPPLHAFKDQNYIGYQRHLCHLGDLRILEEVSLDWLSLGKMRSNPTLLEPLRDVEVLYVNLNSVRASEVPNNSEALPSGLNTEELCQIMKYSGTSDKIKVILIDDFNHTSNSKKEADLIAEVLWYFIEGVNMSITDHPSVNSDFSEFIVYSNYYDQELAFLRNNQSHKWWLKISPAEDNVKFLPCSYEEYQQTISDDIPDRVIKFFDILS